MEEKIENKSFFSLDIDAPTVAGFGAVLASLLALKIYAVTVGDTMIEIPLMLLIGAVALMGLLCVLHLRSLGSESLSKTKSHLNEDLTRLADLIDSSALRLRAIENDGVSQLLELSPRTKDLLNRAKTFIEALEIRYAETKKLLLSGKKLDIFAAYETLHSSINLNKNSLNSLIQSDPMPAIHPHEWEQTVNRLCSELERDIQLSGAHLSSGDYRRVA